MQVSIHPNGGAMIRVMIVDDQAMLRDSLRVAIGQEHDMAVVASLSDASEAPAVVERLGPDLVLMDVCTEGGQSGIAAVRRIKAAHPTVRCIVMTGMPEVTFVEQARESGADGFVYKNVGTRELLALLRSTMAGYQTFPNAPAQDQLVSGLTSDEMGVLRLVCEAKSRREIAEELFLSEGTVKRRISEILAKTGYDSIMRLAVDVVSRGYVVPRLRGE